MSSAPDRPTLLGRCAHAATAAEARFRVPYPNAQPRTASVVALDLRAAAAVAPLAAAGRHRARFLAWDAGRLRAEDGSISSPETALHTSDLVVLVAGRAEAAPAAETLARTCAERGLRPVGVVVAEDARAASAALRPYASVLVESSDPDYLEEMLTALRA